MTETTGSKPPVGIVGAGQMGVGVALCFARAGHPVTVTDPSAEARATAPARLRRGLLHAALAGGERPDVAGTAARVVWTGDPAALGEAVFVVECAVERRPVKEEVFRALDAICPPDTVLASCTSAIPIAALAAVTSRPDRVLGTHFMNPAAVRPAVEVVRAATTGEETLRRTLGLLTAIGKSPIVVSDAPGFVTNRVLMLTINEAATVVHEGTATPEVVDQVFRECFGHPTGPLATADLIGLDTVLDTLHVLHAHTSDPRFLPSPLLVKLVEEGRTGRKRSAGFHTYP
ncbi:3-hydroxyacyl-CoA dehydrogenase family protein [Streptomyces sp. NPDC005876]|uniref:3-hydroxyacyl-CoA dehydrogenase family protein n=1 Tax=unclassified Streptomyces TaxID=2593676 RepID=UPI0033D21889